MDTSNKVAFFIDFAEPEYSLGLIEGARAFFKKQGMEMIIFETGNINSPSKTYGYQRLSIASLISANTVSGMIFVSGPQLYNTTDVVRRLAEELLIVTSAMMPFFAFTNACYFTLRSGGKTLITFLFDSAFVWGVCIPLAFFLSRYTALAILPMYILVQSMELIKCITGFLLVKSRRWVNNLVSGI